MDKKGIKDFFTKDNPYAISIIKNLVDNELDKVTREDVEYKANLRDIIKKLNSL